MRLKAGNNEKPLPLAVGSGVIAGLLTGLSGPSIDFPHLPISLSYSLFFIGAACGLLICPAVISFLARRNYFAWGFVPGAVCILILPIMIYATSRDDPFRLSGSQSVEAFFKDLPRAAMFVCAGVLLSSGPVSLIRLRVDRRHGLEDRENIDPAANAGKEEAWPRPPAVK